MFAICLLAPAAFGLNAPMGVPMRATAGYSRARPAVAGLFDGVKDAFGAGEKPVVSSDRVTPFDRWLGLDKGAPEAVSDAPGDESARYIDPSDAANYFTVMLTKPMGIAFRENEGECGGVYVDEVLDSGSAMGAVPALERRDQLVLVDSTLVLGNDFETAIGAIQNSAAASTKLVFFRGPTSFLYGPTQATPEWYKANLL